MIKIKGVSIWIWLLGVVVLGAVVAIAWPKAKVTLAAAMEPAELEIVKEDVWRVGRGYGVRGSIHNPRRDAVRNVKISYSLIGKTKGKKFEVGNVAAEIKYLPACGTVDFTAVGHTILMVDGVEIVLSGCTIVEKREK